MNYSFHFLSFFFYVPALFWLLCAFILGIIASSFLIPCIVSCAIVLPLILIQAWFIYIKKIDYDYAWVILIGIFFSLGAYHYEKTIGDYKRNTALIAGKFMCLRGTITDINSLDHPRFKQLTSIAITEARTEDNSLIKEITGKSIYVYSAKKSHFTVDDQIELPDVRINQPKKPSIQLYLQKENTIGTLVRDLNAEKLLHRPTSSIKRWLYEKKTLLFSRLRSRMSAKTFTFFSAFFLGNRKINKNENDALKQSCKYWGISHYLARSGLHLVIFIMVWEYMLRFIPLAFIAKQLILLLLTIMYFLLTWNSISFFRAFLTFLCYRFFLLTSMQSHTLHAIIFVSLIVLLFNPSQLFFLDFQLSFGITFLLSWINQLKMREKRRVQQKP
ncbi:MAG TPA: ComEC/Rec2 family competence protein [Candidatus Babeliales bacterium]|nr:ComEC/Rec2 family competence protein [Candidatus Babeliales bacterium]